MIHAIDRCKKHVIMDSRSCNGIVMELVEFTNKRGILIAALQETKLSRRNPLSCSSSYNVLRKDRKKNNGGGIAFLVSFFVRSVLDH